MSGWRVTRDQDTVVLEYHEPCGDAGDYVQNRYEYSLSRGGQLMLFLGHDPYVDEKWTYQFAQINKVWVPSHVEYENHTRYQDGKRRHSIRVISWTQNTINQPIPADIFSLESIGVRAGDRVTDARSSLFYTYRKDLAPTDIASGKIMRKSPVVQASPAVTTASNFRTHVAPHALSRIVLFWLGVLLTALGILWIFSHRNSAGAHNA